MGRKLALLLNLALCLIATNSYAYTTYYTRVDGGTATQCTGIVDAAYPGSGTAQACAYIHPFWALSPIGNNPTKLAPGDTLIIGPGQYRIGYGAPNTSDTLNCHYSYPYTCYSRPVPSGPDTAHPTRILGKGYDTGCASPPQLWGNERVYKILNLNNSNNVEVQCLDVTDHSACQEFGPSACQRDTFPFGPWGETGLEASNSSNVLIKNVDIHGLFRGVHAGHLNNWTIIDSDIIANSFVGWDGDIGAGLSSNSGTILFQGSRIRYSGCGETYPGKAPYNCYSQDQGGYGDGLGTQQTGGDWIFDNVDISRNVSDGIDLLYHDGNGKVVITDSTIKENAGNQIKTNTPVTIDNTAIDGNCAYFNGNSITWQSSGFNNCRAGGDALYAVFAPGRQVRITNSSFTNVVGQIAITSGGSSCNGTEVMGVDAATTFQLLDRFLSPGSTAVKYYAAGAGGNGDGSCGTLALTTIPSTCTSNGTCSASTPNCGSTTSGVDNCGNICTKTGASCTTCTSNGSCSASTPGCGQTTFGVDNCGNSCSKTGAACSGCVPTPGVCSAQTPSCGQTTSGQDTCGGSCVKTGSACCVPDGTCTAVPPTCGQTTTGVDSCGSTCAKVGAPCCIPNGSCSATNPSCGVTTTGLDNCGNACSKVGATCCIADGTCSAPAPLCGKITIGVDSCGVTCTRTGAACEGAKTYNLNWNNFRRNTLFYTSEVKKSNIVYITFQGNDYQMINYKAVILPSTTKKYAISMFEFLNYPKYYTDNILVGSKVYILQYNNGSYEITKKP